jgi:hypothetical protein
MPKNKKTPLLKKCPSCSSEAQGPLCPFCGMLTEEQDPVSGFTRGDDYILQTLKAQKAKE